MNKSNKGDFLSLLFNFISIRFLRGSAACCCHCPSSPSFNSKSTKKKKICSESNELGTGFYCHLFSYTYHLRRKRMKAGKKTKWKDRGNESAKKTSTSSSNQYRNFVYQWIFYGPLFLLLLVLSSHELLLLLFWYLSPIFFLLRIRLYPHLLG